MPNPVNKDGAFCFVDVTPKDTKPNQDAATIKAQFRVISFSTGYAGKVGDIPTKPYRELYSRVGKDKWFASGEQEKMKQFGLRKTAEITNEAMKPVFDAVGGVDLTFTINKDAFDKKNKTGAVVGTAQVASLSDPATVQTLNVYRVADADGKAFNIDNYGDFYVMYIATPGPAPSKQ